jgi:hypothetical protein
VLEALALVPAEPQQAVRRHALDGLTRWAIAGRAGVPVGTLNARVPWARLRVRPPGGRAVADAPEPIPASAAAVSMSAGALHALIVRAPTDAAGPWPAAHASNPRADQMRRQMEREIRRLAPRCVVLRTEQAGARLLPMGSGLSAGLALTRHWRALTTPRPLTADLTAR